MLKRIYAIILILIFTILNTAFVAAPTNNTKMKYTHHFDQIFLKDNNMDNTDNEFIPRITVDRSDTDRIVEVVEYRYEITDKEFEEFVRVVEAEVTGDHPFGLNYEDTFQSKLHVAQVILNRVESPYFPNTVHDVIFQKNAFTPLVDGRYWQVEISQVTIDACRTALLASTEDTTYGCEFFSSRTKTCKYGSYVFTDKVGHSFFSYYRNNE